VSEKTLKTIRIKWVRSGIGFTFHQKTIVRSLGLNKLNHTVVRPDTPQIRGIVAAVPHLLEIVPEPKAPAWASIPEYTVHHAPVVEPAAPAEPVHVAETKPAEEEAAPVEAKEKPAAKTKAKAPKTKSESGKHESPKHESAKHEGAKHEPAKHATAKSATAKHDGEDKKKSSPDAKKPAKKSKG